eukprot:1048169-Amphidinium_carterae.1
MADSGSQHNASKRSRTHNISSQSEQSPEQTKQPTAAEGNGDQVQHEPHPQQATTNKAKATKQPHDTKEQQAAGSTTAQVLSEAVVELHRGQHRDKWREHSYTSA